MDLERAASTATLATGDQSAALAITIAWIVASYFSGAIPFGPIVARMRGVDLRKVGSGNIGATNVARALGKPLGILVFLCDAAKGLAPVLLTEIVIRRAISPALLGAPDSPWSNALADHWFCAAAGAAAFLGHITSPFLGFRGGKGVATAFGVFVAIAPAAASMALAIFGLTYAITRISSLGSLLSATVFLPALHFLGHPRAGDWALAVFMWLLIFVRHHDNLRRLLRHEEGKL